MDDDDPVGDDTADAGTTAMGSDDGGTDPDTGDPDPGTSSGTTEPGTTDDGGSTEDGDTGTDGSTGAPAFSISGTVGRLRMATPVRGADGIGTLYVGALQSCELTAPLLAAAIVPDADFSSADAAVDYTIEGLADGTVHLALFLDDDGNADPMAPGPSPGDLVYATGVGDGILSCIEVEIAGADVQDVALTLTATVPGA